MKSSICLLFTHGNQLGQAITDQLKDLGYQVISVIPFTGFENSNKTTYRINPNAKDDYHQLFYDLKSEQLTPTRIIHSWAINDESQASRIKNFESYSLLSFHSLVFIAQSLDTVFEKDDFEIKILSDQLHNVHGNEAIKYEQAVLIGPCRVINQEYPNLKCTNIDIGSANYIGDRQQLKQLIAELTAHANDTVVALRGRYRWLPLYDKIAVSEPVSDLLPLSPGGTYVITGGLGGIGMIVAEFLAEKTNARLALISRTALPPQGRWNELAAADDTPDPLKNKLHSLMAIEKKCLELLTLSADVTDLQQMKNVADTIAGRWGEINGVIHAAGIPGGGIIQLKDTDSARRVMASKTRGTLVLAETLGGMVSDFFILCSSAISLVGGIGQVDYCAANAFLDAFAQARTLKCRTIAVNWCAWKDIGMTATKTMPDGFQPDQARNPEIGLTAREGQKAFAHVLTLALPQVIVSTQDLSSRLKLAHEKPTGERPVEQQPESHPHSPKARERPTLTSDYIIPGSDTEVTIAQIWSEVLGIEKVGIHDNFFDLGGHSLLVAKIVSRMRTAFSLELPLEVLIENPTVSLLSELVLAKQQPHPKDEFANSSQRGRKRRAWLAKKKVAAQINNKISRL